MIHKAKLSKTYKSHRNPKYIPKYISAKRSKRLHKLHHTRSRKLNHTPRRQPRSVRYGKLNQKSRRKLNQKSRRKLNQKSRRKLNQKSRRRYRCIRSDKQRYKMFSALRSIGKTALSGGDIFNVPDYFDHVDQLHGKELSQEHAKKNWEKIIEMLQSQQKLEKQYIIADQLKKKIDYENIKKRQSYYTNKKLDELHQIAQDSINRQQYNKADAIYIDILNHRIDLHAMVMLGNLRMEQAQDNMFALKLFNNVLKIDPGNPHGLFYSSWLSYLLGVETQLAEQRIIDLLRQSPRKNLLQILGFIEKRNINELDTAIQYLMIVYNHLPKDMLVNKELKTMQKGIVQHIELLKQRRRDMIVDTIVDENDDNLPYASEIYDPDDDSDE